MSDVLRGIGVVTGVAIGKIKIISQDFMEHLARYEADSSEKEQEKFITALQTAIAQVEKMIADAHDKQKKNQADIMGTHLFMLNDPALKDTVLQKINDFVPAPKAVLASTEEYAAVFRNMEDQYLRERATDILDIGRRVIRILLKVDNVDIGAEPVILYAQDIDPSVLADIPANFIQGLILQHGSTTSHAVIIAKARGIVTVVGVDGLENLVDKTLVVVDGTNGKVVISPEGAELCRYSAQAEKERERYQREIAKASLPAVTLDGIKVQLAANIGLPQDMEQAVKFGCEGVGLYRTEFLFMGKDVLPTEEEQFLAYRSAVEKCGQYLCVIRTMDIGGDKPLAYLDIGAEQNPFLGWRAIRICLERTDLLITQLKAILRAGVYGKAAIMLPMVINRSEIRQAKECLRQAANELARERKSFSQNVPLGIMVETPAAAVMAADLAQECDFFSIGTNDLVQYTLAVDRGNQKVRTLYDHFHPAVIRLIHHVILAAHQQGIWVGMCGEMASDPLAAILLLGMGIDELSMSSMPKVKASIRTIDIKRAQNLLQKVLLLADGEKIREYLAEAVGS